MCKAVNTPLSAYETIGRVINYPSHIKNNNVIRNSAFYPRNKPDTTNPGYFTNKISMCRLCMASAKGSINWDIHDRINKELFKDKTFKGFLVGRVSEFCLSNIISVEPAASAKNPFHMHLVLNNYRMPYRDDVESVSELIDEDTRKQLDRFRRNCLFITKEMIDAEVDCLCKKCSDANDGINLLT